MGERIFTDARWNILQQIAGACDAQAECSGCLSRRRRRKKKVQPKCSAAYKATVAAHSVMKVEVTEFMRAMPEESTLCLSAHDFSVKFRPVIVPNLHFFPPTGFSLIELPYLCNYFARFRSLSSFLLFFSHFFHFHQLCTPNSLL